MGISVADQSFFSAAGWPCPKREHFPDIPPKKTMILVGCLAQTAGQVLPGENGWLLDPAVWSKPVYNNLTIIFFLFAIPAVANHLKYPTEYCSYSRWCGVCSKPKCHRRYLCALLRAVVCASLTSWLHHLVPLHLPLAECVRVCASSLSFSGTFWGKKINRKCTMYPWFTLATPHRLLPICYRYNPTFRSWDPEQHLFV